MTQRITLSAQVPISAAGQRLDQVSAQLFPEYSRSRIQDWIRNGDLTVSGRAVKVNSKVCGGERLKLDAVCTEQGDWQAEDLPIEIVHEDEHILVVNKAPGLVVHPAAGNYSGTMLNGLLHHWPQLETLPRAGIVHRLDKDTSGLMVVAKTLPAQTSLVEQLQARSVKREYCALALGHCDRSGTIEGLIGRDKNNRKKMAVVQTGGKPAITHYRLSQRLGPFSLLDVRLETGRTHQIRVHMAHLGYPLLGDPVYGKALPRKIVMDDSLRRTLESFSRQALHAKQLALQHPVTKDVISWTAPLPQDFSDILNALTQAGLE